MCRSPRRCCVLKWKRVTCRQEVSFLDTERRRCPAQAPCPGAAWRRAGCGARRQRVRAEASGGASEPASQPLGRMRCGGSGPGTSAAPGLLGDLGLSSCPAGGRRSSLIPSPAAPRWGRAASAALAAGRAGPIWGAPAAADGWGRGGAGLRGAELPPSLSITHGCCKQARKQLFRAINEDEAFRFRGLKNGLMRLIWGAQKQTELG